MGAYHLVEDEDGQPRISAVTDRFDIEIVGAYQPRDRAHWALYFTPLLAAAADMPFHPHQVPLLSRDDARDWVELIAHLWAHAHAEQDANISGAVAHIEEVA